ncbi:MAG: NADPH-dependent FMN reductase [Alphaproteobacteria bacterium]
METINLGLIYGSTRAGRLCDRVGAWVAAQVARNESFAVDLIDPAALGLPARIEREDPPAVTALERRIADADAFVVVTPEYNHGYPAPLKQLIDLVSVPWQAKPVAFVSYGGASGGIRAVEQLRLVFAELHAVTLRDTVSFAGAHARFAGDGGLAQPERAERAMATMLARLRWWALALGEARRARPYTLAAL